LLHWYNRDVMDCGHRGLVDIDTGNCFTCEQAESKKQSAKPVKVSKPPVAPLPPPTPGQIAEAQRQERERKQAQNRERQRRYKANQKKLAEIEKKKAPVTDNN